MTPTITSAWRHIPEIRIQEPCGSQICQDPRRRSDSDVREHSAIDAQGWSNVCKYRHCGTRLRRFAREHLDLSANAFVERVRDGEGGRPDPRGHNNRRGRSGIGDAVGTYDDEERRMWLRKDEALYLWALREGVQL
jgi:hypothetical protein